MSPIRLLLPPSMYDTTSLVLYLLLLLLRPVIPLRSRNLNIYFHSLFLLLPASLPSLPLPLR
jgi:hypothetical protein